MLPQSGASAWFGATVPMGVVPQCLTAQVMPKVRVESLAGDVLQEAGRRGIRQFWITGGRALRHEPAQRRDLGGRDLLVTLPEVVAELRKHAAPKSGNSAISL